ncbi:MAG: helix-turn-helix domain-containing protein [Alphaproteobacteria bacterium]|nr:helix-turn-helix domain-containing protein [Alphaproteobacteria bacterium]
MGRGATIRARRLALGRSLEQVSASTKIPVAHLEAIEEDRVEDLPAGPYAAAYLRALQSELELDASSESEPEPATAPPSGAPLWLVRAIAGASVIGLIIVLASFTWERLAHRIAPGTPVDAPPDQVVVIQPLRTTTLRVVTDGEPRHEGQVSGGQRLEFEARDSIEVEVRAISDVKLEWNGQEIVPQGRQDAPRRLVFQDDDDATPLGALVPR